MDGVFILFSKNLKTCTGSPHAAFRGGGLVGLGSTQ